MSLSNGSDAAKMLRTCVQLAETGRVIVFLEPIALYMTKDLYMPGDNKWLFYYPKPHETIELGEINVTGEGDTIILSYANGYYLSKQAAKILKEEYQILVKVIDIRGLSPLPIQAILQEITDSSIILIVEEGCRSGSLSEGLMTLLIEHAPLIKIKRLTGQEILRLRRKENG